MRRRRAFGLSGDLGRNGSLAEQPQGYQCRRGKLWRTETSIELAEGVVHCLVIVVRLVRPLGTAAKVTADGALLLAPAFAQRSESGFQGCGQGVGGLAIHV